MEITVPPIGFIGMPLFLGSLSRKFRLPKVRDLGEQLTNFANGAEGQRFLTADGWSDSTDGDRQMVVRWLSKLPKLPPRMLKEIADYAKQIQPQSTKIGSAVDKGQISLWSNTKCLPPSNKIAYGYLMASLLSGGHGENFARCPECGVWFFDVPSGRPMKKFCSQPHANRHRQRKFREKRK